MDPLERADYKRAVEGVLACLGEKASSRAWTEGRNMTPEQALVRREPHMIPTTTPPPASSSLLGWTDAARDGRVASTCSGLDQRTN